jgi:Tol biopolymer transport system component
MRKIFNISILLIFFQPCFAQTDYLFFDTNIPDTVPKVFAENTFNKDSSYIGYCSFDRDSKEFYYAITNRQWNTSQILKLNVVGKIDTVKFNINKQWEGEPMFTYDNKRMYFTAVIPPKENQDWQSDIFYVERTGKSWSKPKEFELNSPQSEWHISFTKNNVAYFGSEREGGRLKADIFYSKPENGIYKKAIKLPLTVNTEYNDCDPLIAPDESYLIFHSERSGGYGDHDLYITFRKGENEWTTPVNMGKEINSLGWEMGPSFSSDGKYLFFTRRKSWDTKEPSKIYWVDSTVIEKYRLKSQCKDNNE